MDVFVVFVVRSERNLGFSGYNDDAKDTLADRATATSTETSELRANREITSDINRNPLKNPQTTTVDNSSAVLRGGSSSRNNASSEGLADDKDRERLDENYADSRHDPSSQVLFCFFVQYQSITVFISGLFVLSCRSDMIPTKHNVGQIQTTHKTILFPLALL